MAIRPFTIADTTSVVKLYGELWQDLHVDTPYTVDALRAYAAMNETGAIVCDDGGVVGFGSYQIKGAIWLQGDYMYIPELVVSAPARGKGIGTLILNALKRIAVVNRCKRIELDAGHWRKESHAFYLRYGFEISGSVFTYKNV